MHEHNMYDDMYVYSFKADYRCLSIHFIRLFLALSFIIMVVLQHSFYLIALILAKYQASLIFSQPQDTIRSLIQGRDSVDFTNSEPADSIALPDTRSDEYPNDITFDHTHLEGDNFVPSQSTLVSASVPGAEISQEPAGNSQDSAFLPWDGNGEGVPDLIPNLPSLSLPSLPKANQIFENIMKGGIQPQEPDCDDGLFSFCCESGPPRSKIKKETPAARVLEIEAERKQRLRKCVKCLSISPSIVILSPYFRSACGLGEVL